MEKSKKLLKLDDLKPCYLYISRSSSVLDEKIDGIKKFCRDKINFDIDFKIFDAKEDIDEKEFNNFINTSSFFSTKKLAVIKNIEYMSSNLLGILINSLINVTAKNGSVVYVITASRDRLNSKLMEAVKEVGYIKILKSPLSKNLKRWLEEKSQLDGIKFTRKAADTFIENINSDLNLLKIEYEKLCTYISSEKEKFIDEEIVKSLVRRIYSLKVFDLIDFIGARDKNNSLKALEAILEEKQSLIGMLTLIHRMFKCLLYLKSERGRELARDYLIKNIKAPDYFINKIIHKYIKYSKNYSEVEIVKIFKILSNYDLNFRRTDIESKNLAQKLILEIIDING